MHMNRTLQTTDVNPFQISDLPEGVSMHAENDELRIHAKPEAEGTIVLRLEGSDPVDARIHLRADRNSRLKVVVFQNLSDTTDLQLQTITQADESAQIDLLQFHLGARSATGDIIQEAIGKEASINTDLLCRTKKEQIHQFNLKNVYRKRNGRGRMTAKGAALDKSRLGMHGCIAIDQTGGGTDANLTQDSLLLSPDATVKATPSLEIDTNDVKAAHGASISNLNEESLFYLTSRGIDEKTARKMLISGFLTEQLDKISDLPELKKEIETIL